MSTPRWSQAGVPALVSGASNASALSLAVDDRLMGVPRATPGNTLVGVLISAWRNIPAAAGSIIDTVTRKVTSTDNGAKITAYDAAANGAPTKAVFTAATPSASSSLFGISDVTALDTILGGDEGKGLWFGSIQGSSMSLEALLNAVTNKLGSLDKHALLAVNQAAGTVTIGQFASNALQTTAADTLRASPPADPAVCVTHEIPAAVGSIGASRPNFGL